MSYNIEKKKFHSYNIDISNINTKIKVRTISVQRLDLQNITELIY